MVEYNFCSCDNNNNLIIEVIKQWVSDKVSVSNKIVNKLWYFFINRKDEIKHLLKIKGIIYSKENKKPSDYNEIKEMEEKIELLQSLYSDIVLFDSVIDEYIWYGKNTTQMMNNILYNIIEENKKNNFNTN